MSNRNDSDSVVAMLIFCKLNTLTPAFFFFEFISNDLIDTYKSNSNHKHVPASILFICSQGTATDLVVQIVLIAESMRLQAMMATYGIQTQTPHEVRKLTS